MACQFANIVASQTWTSQSSALSATTVYTPAAAGLFRVSAYLDGVVASQSASTTIAWTDSHQSRSSSLNSLGNASAPSAQVLWSAASDPIQVSTVFSGTGTYNLYVVVEQLI